MGQRATRYGARRGTGAGASGRALRASVLVAALAVLVMAAPVRAQQAAVGGALVEIPSVSELDVVSAEHTLSSSGEAVGTLQVRVRANHRWSLVLASAGSADSAVEVRVSSGAGGFERLGPGSQAVVYSGQRGETIVELQYRTDSMIDPTSLPLTYTLATD